MNIVLMSPHFPDSQKYYAQALKRQGATVLGLGDEPVQGLSPLLQAQLDDYYQVPDMHQYDALVRTCGLITWQHGKIDRLDSLNEYWLETEARLRTDFNIVGIHTDRIAEIKQKSEMKRLFQAHGVPCAAGEVIQSEQQALAFAAQQGYPLVLKPNVGVGASQTHRINSEHELLARLRDATQPMILEAFIEGQIVTFDGLANRQGEAVFTASMVYSDGVMEVVNRDDHIHFYTLREIPADLEALGRKLLQIFQVRERFFHFEFFRQPDGQLVALEVNIRPPGGPSIDMCNYAHDLDLYQEWANVLLHNHFNAQVERKYHCLYVGRKQHKAYQLNHRQVLEHFAEPLVYHATLPVIFRRAMGDAYYLLRGPELEPLLEAAAQIQAVHV